MRQNAVSGLFRPSWVAKATPTALPPVISAGQWLLRCCLVEIFSLIFCRVTSDWKNQVFSLECRFHLQYVTSGLTSRLSKRKSCFHVQCHFRSKFKIFEPEVTLSRTTSISIENYDSETGNDVTEKFFLPDRFSGWHKKKTAHVYC